LQPFALFVVRNKFWEALGSYCDACGLQYKPGSQKRSRDKESYDIQRSNKFCNWETHHFGPRWPIWAEWKLSLDISWIMLRVSSYINRKYFSSFPLQFWLR
jgi:hypothetical protein